jgi:hypothetical protein
MLRTSPPMFRQGIQRMPKLARPIRQFGGVPIEARIEILENKAQDLQKTLNGACDDVISFRDELQTVRTLQQKQRLYNKLYCAAFGVIGFGVAAVTRKN